MANDKDEQPKRPTLRAIIGPHAGFRYEDTKSWKNRRDGLLRGADSVSCVQIFGPHGGVRVPSLTGLGPDQTRVYPRTFSSFLSAVGTAVH